MHGRVSWISSDGASVNTSHSPAGARYFTDRLFGWNTTFTNISTKSASELNENTRACPSCIRWQVASACAWVRACIPAASTVITFDRTIGIDACRHVGGHSRETTVAGTTNPNSFSDVTATPWMASGKSIIAGARNVLKGNVIVAAKATASAATAETTETGLRERKGENQGNENSLHGIG